MLREVVGMGGVWNRCVRLGGGANGRVETGEYTGCSVEYPFVQMAVYIQTVNTNTRPHTQAPNRPVYHPNRPRSLPFFQLYTHLPPPTLLPFHTQPHISYPNYIPLRAHPPLRLAPVRRAAETRPGPTEVAAGAAQSGRTLGVDDRSAGVAGVGGFRWGGGERGCGLVVAFAVAGLAAGAAVEALILELGERELVLGVEGSVRGGSGGEVW